jgi:hypothetical protein
MWPIPPHALQVIFNSFGGFCGGAGGVGFSFSFFGATTIFSFFGFGPGFVDVIGAC